MAICKGTDWPVEEGLLPFSLKSGQYTVQTVSPRSLLIARPVGERKFTAKYATQQACIATEPHAIDARRQDWRKSATSQCDAGTLAALSHDLVVINAICAAAL